MAADRGREIMKRLWAAQPALLENLWTRDRVDALHRDFIAYLDEVFTGDTLPALRYQKLQAARSRTATWHKEGDPYPASPPWGRFEPYLELLEQHEAERTIKRRLEMDGMFVESRHRGDDGDEHLLVGDRDGSGEKAHIIIGGKTGEIRVKDNGVDAHKLVTKIRTVITLKNGEEVESTRSFLQRVGDD